MKLVLVPCAFALAVEYIDRHHRHHPPPQGWKFGLAALSDHGTAGVVTVGRPVARALDDGRTLEVTRCCTDGTKNAASFLYAAAWRATRALGYERLITYTLKDANRAEDTMGGDSVTRSFVCRTCKLTRWTKAKTRRLKCLSCKRRQPEPALERTGKCHGCAGAVGALRVWCDGCKSKRNSARVKAWNSAKKGVGDGAEAR